MGAGDRVLTIGGQASLPISDFFQMGECFGNKWYVKSTVTTSGDGKSWTYAFKTITEAVAAASAGDIIYLYSGLSSATQFNEAVAVTSKAGIRFIGAGTNPNQALWTAPNTTAPALTFTASPDFEVSNIRFRPPLANAAIALAGVSHNGRIMGVRFQGKTGSKYGIHTEGGQANIQILDCEFFYINTATGAYGIFGETYTTAEPTGWILERNKFHSNLNHIVCRMRQSIIRENTFAAAGLLADSSTSATVTVLGIDIHGATGGCNVVTRNDLAGLYHQAHYYGGTNDSWAGNFCTDRTHATQVDATTGISILAPAA